MDQTFSGLIISLTVAGVTALGVLAYRHPRAYNKLGRAVMGWLVIAFVLSVVWNLSNGAASLAVTAGSLDPLGTDTRAEAAVAATIRAVAVPTWVVLALLASIIYLTALAHLPRLLAWDDLPTKKEGDGEGRKQDS